MMTNQLRQPRRTIVALVLAIACSTVVNGQAQRPPDQPYEPTVGQAGKNVIWVPTPETLVEKMLDIAQLTPSDYVIDLGSGDGRNVIAAARRGATALGVEYNPDMVVLARTRAAAAGVSERATFVEGDMYQADISKATVMALFLLPSNMLQLRQKFFNLAPGSRIVSNTFGMEGWEADYTETQPDCSEWCTVRLWIVPAKVAGAWQLPAGMLALTQDFQNLSGTLGEQAVTGKLRGTEIAFTVGATEYTGRVNGTVIEGVSNGTPFRATRLN